MNLVAEIKRKIFEDIMEINGTIFKQSVLVLLLVTELNLSGSALMQWRPEIECLVKLLSSHGRLQLRSVCLKYIGQ